MQRTILTDPGVRVEYIPAHQYLGVYEPDADEYAYFWRMHECDSVCEVIDRYRYQAEPVVGAHTGGWYRTEGGWHGFCYGVGLPEQYRGSAPEGFEVRSFPGSYYLVFYHPAFDFHRCNAEVMRRVEALAWGCNPERYGFMWNEESNQCYQRHKPDTVGYEVLRPVRRWDEG